MATKKQKNHVKQSLTEFVRAERRAACVVCRLPAEVIADLRDATSKKFRRDVQLRWLAACGYKITNEQLNNHYSGKHDHDIS